MRVLFGGLLAVGVMLASHASAFSCGDHPAFSVIGDDGSRTSLYIPNDISSDVPRWSPGDGDPPLSLAVAIDSAQQWAKTKYPQFEKVSIHSISLQSNGCFSSGSNWYYLINFMFYLNGNPLFGSSPFIGILMDGTIIEPSRESSGE